MMSKLEGWRCHDTMTDVEGAIGDGASREHLAGRRDSVLGC
jgi:hypothetical protein